MVRSSRRIGVAVEGSTCVMKIAISSSAGSIQNEVVAAPPQAYSPATPGNQRPRRVERHGNPEAEADAVVGRLREQRPRQFRQRPAAGQMIRRHQGQRLRADQPDAVQFAAVEQRAAEGEIVGRGRTQAAAAGDERGRRQEGAGRRIILQGEAALAVGGVKGHRALGARRIAGGQAMGLVGGIRRSLCPSFQADRKYAPEGTARTACR